MFGLPMDESISLSSAGDSGKADPPFQKHCCLEIQAACRQRRGFQVEIFCRSKDSHRCEQLTSLADEFLNDWRKGVKEGPTPEIMAALDTLTDK
eukprot:gene12996-5360_t